MAGKWREQTSLPKVGRDLRGHGTVCTERPRSQFTGDGCGWGRP